jgi:hypothetical protein
MSPNRLVPTTALIGLALAASACAGVNAMQPVYAKAAIRDLDVRTEADQLSLRYKYPPETAYFSGGVNLERHDDLIRVVIARCKVDERCEPDVPSHLPRPTHFEAAVRIPWKGERVVLVHADGEQQLSP